MVMGFLDRLKEVLGRSQQERGRERAAAAETQQAAPGGGVPPETQTAPEPASGLAQKGTAATGAATGDPVPEGTGRTDPAVQSASAEQSPQDQREAAAEDPAGTIEPGSEGQDQEPR
jgi:hypothetical protein